MLKNKKIKVRHFAGTNVGSRLVPTLDPLGSRVRRVFVDFTDTDRHEYTPGKVRTLQRGGRRGGGTKGETEGETGGAQTHTDAARSGGRALVDTRAGDGGTKKGPWRISVSKISREVGVY